MLMAIEIGQVVHDFAIIMIVAGAMAIISIKLIQPMVIGYILAGMAIGPYTQPFNLILNIEVLNLFAEIGIILLLLVVGMEFPLAKLSDRKKGFCNCTLRSVSSIYCWLSLWPLCLKFLIL
jgi:monovalent cation:H+ antiporter-2, CPA2 family